MKKIVAIGYRVPKRGGYRKSRIRVTPAMHTDPTGRAHKFSQTPQDLPAEVLQKLRDLSQNRDRLLDSGFIYEFTKADSPLNDPTEDINYIMNIITALSILAENPNLCPQLIPAIPALTDLLTRLTSQHSALTPQETYILYHASTTLTILSENPKAREKIRDTKGAIPALTRLIISLASQYSALTTQQINLLQFTTVVWANLAQKQTAQMQMLATDKAAIPALEKLVTKVNTQASELTPQQKNIREYTNKILKELPPIA
jgi:hypothetical protein